MNYTLTINGTPQELKEALSALEGMTPETAPKVDTKPAEAVTPAPVTEEVAKPKKAAKKPAESPKKAPEVKVDTQPAEEEKPAPVTEEAPAAQPETTTPKVTLDQLKDAGRKAAAAGRRDAVRAVLTKYGAPMLSQIPEDHWSEALADLTTAVEGG